MTRSATASKRAVRARPLRAVSPAAVSQYTAYDVLGIDERRFREHLVPLCAGRVARLGKVILIPLDVALARLADLAAEQASSTDAVTSEQIDTSADIDRDLDDVDGVLAVIGRRRVTRMK